MKMTYLQLPEEFKIDDVDHCFESNRAFFTLVSGCSCITCYANADLVIDKYEVKVSEDIQQNKDMDFKYLVVNGAVIIDQSDIEICAIQGQTIGLTEKQRNDLNEILKEKMEVVK